MGLIDATLATISDAGFNSWEDNVLGEVFNKSLVRQTQCQLKQSSNVAVLTPKVDSSGKDLYQFFYQILGKGSWVSVLHNINNNKTKPDEGKGMFLFARCFLQIDYHYWFPQMPMIKYMNAVTPQKLPKQIKTDHAFHVAFAQKKYLQYWNLQSLHITLDERWTSHRTCSQTVTECATPSLVH